MPPKGKQKKQSIRSSQMIDEFNDFALTCKDYGGEPFFIMNGTQVVQNYRCTLIYEDILTQWRKQK